MDLSDLLHASGIRRRTVQFWNANNAYSFERIDWNRLAFTNTITAVSRYMRAIIRARGADALVIPNGIPLRLVNRRPELGAGRFRASMPDRVLFFKMARWEKEKGWSQALDALRTLKQNGMPATLIARSGGPSGGRSALREAVAQRSLSYVSAASEPGLHAQLPDLARSPVDVVDLRFGVNEELAAQLFQASDGVLANSVSEPFGLVGLEAMAAGGVVYTGGTGEDYAVSGKNAVVLETTDAREIARRSVQLSEQPEVGARLRRAARRTARSYTWEKVVKMLVSRAEEVAAAQTA
jgi:glycosyltransferase involved in cell wall biosynthesis